MTSGVFMPEVNEFDNDSSWLALRVNAECEEYRKKNNTTDILTLEAQTKLYVDTSVSSPEKMASVGMDCIVRAGITLQEYSDTYTSDLPSMVKQLRSHCTKLNPEKTLIAQSVTLDAMFNSLAVQASCVGLNTNTDKAEQLMRLAFKAQAQCAKTLQVILHNEQTKKSKPNEQLVSDCIGESNGSEKMDSGTTTGTIESNTAMATLVCIEGGKN